MEKALKIISILLILFIVIFLSIGYSAFQSSLVVSDIKSIVRAYADIRVTGVTASGANNGYTSYDEYDVTSIESEIVLPNTNSTITYNVEITNLGSQDMALTNITGLPNTMEIKNINYTYGTKLCDNTRCHNGSINTITFTVGYKSTVTEGTNNSTLIHADFIFKKVFSITYNNFADTTGLATEILQDEVKTIDFSSLSSIPNNVSVTGATESFSNSILTLSNAFDDVVISASYNSNIPDGSQEHPYENTSSIYTTTGLQEGYTIFTEAPGNPLVVVDENNKITEFSFTDKNASVNLNSSPLNTEILAFDGDNITIHLKFTTIFNDNTRKNVLGALSFNSATNKYSGFVLDVYQAYDIRIYALNNATINSYGYGGTLIYSFSITQALSRINTEYTIDITYTSSTKTITTTMNPGNNSGTSNTQSKSSTVFPTSLADATVTVGGNGANSTYDMNSMTVSEFSVVKG